MKWSAISDATPRCFVAHYEPYTTADDLKPGMPADATFQESGKHPEK